MVHGYDVSLGGGDALNIGSGLAIDPAGRVLLTPEPTRVGIQELIDLSLKRSPSPAAANGPAAFGDCVSAPRPTRSSPGRATSGSSPSVTPSALRRGGCLRPGFRRGLRDQR